MRFEVQLIVGVVSKDLQHAGNHVLILLTPRRALEGPGQLNDLWVLFLAGHICGIV